MTNIFESQSEGEESRKAERAVEESAARQLKVAAEVAERASAARKERDIVKRAKALEMEIQFKDVKKVRQGDMFIPQPQMTDQNKIVVLDALFNGENEFPHRDHFKGRIVDHEGKVIDDHYPVIKWVEAFAAAGLKGVSTKAAREAIREWALQHERNDLIEYVQAHMPEWDGKERMRMKLIEFFETHDTLLNRDFSQYFWLALYMRIMAPGSIAPIVLSLFGAQGCGKSRFSKHLCRVLTGNPEADSVQLNLDGDRLEFLRNITGSSIIASVGEMTGFTRGDLNKIKDFITREADQMHYKFEGTFNQQRQWITVMDGNKYEGLQRDDSGNRRFYPMFCGQLPDLLNKPQWDAGFTVKQEYWDTFEEDVWQIMAECAAWLDENGESAYEGFVRRVIKQVFDFSQAEMDRDSGTITDDVFDVYLVPMLKECPKILWQKQGHAEKCVGVKTGEFKLHFMNTLKHVRPNWRHLKNKMRALGAIEHSFSGGYAGFLFPEFTAIDTFVEKIGSVEYDDGGTVGEVRKPDGNGGF